MDAPQKPATALPPMVHVFEIDVKGEETGQTFRGELTYKRPTLRDKAAIAILFAKLKKDTADLNEDVALLLYMSAHLKTTIIEAPAWFLDSNGGLDLYDANVVTDIYMATMNFENEWRKQVFPEKDDAKKSQ